jgi:HEAT repeat protein
LYLLRSAQIGLVIGYPENTVSRTHTRTPEAMTDGLGVGLKVMVPCAEGKRHQVRLRFTGWGEYEVVYNPCEELLGAVFARMAGCTHYLREKFPTRLHIDRRLKLRLVKAFQAQGLPAMPVLREALGDYDNQVRYAACAALGQLSDLQVVPVLIEALRDREVEVRRLAWNALARFGAPVVPALLEAVESKDWWVREGACRALGAIGDPIAVPALVRALNDDYHWVRQAARDALVRIGAPAVPALIQLLDEWEKHAEFVRRLACHALALIGDLRAVPALIQTLHNLSSDARTPAKTALIKLGAPVVPALIEALQQEDWLFRVEVCRVLGAIRDPSAVPALIQALRDPDISFAVCEALGQIGDPQAVPVLIDFLTHTNSPYRHAACVALGKIGDPSAIPHLERLLSADSSLSRFAATAIERIRAQQAEKEQRAQP